MKLAPNVVSEHPDSSFASRVPLLRKEILRASRRILETTVRSKLDVNAEIERRIAERDRLLARAQRLSVKSTEMPAVAPLAPIEFASLGERVVALEKALANLADPSWVADCSIDQIVAHARQALAGIDPSVQPAPASDEKTSATSRARRWRIG